MKREIIVLLILTGIFVLIAGGVFVSGVSVSSASAITFQPRASFQAVYGPEDRLKTYWPILAEDREECTARQDIILQVAPAGCQPMVVRSDLLAEQNVPVFCQINALQINPLVDIEQIRSIVFSGKYPKEVITAGFHPARAALRTRDKLLGSPLINNIGYIVVVLKRNELEKSLPDFINVNLTARLDYDMGNAYGIGRAEFILEPTSDEEWEQEKFKNSFWNGRYFVRLERADPNYVYVSLYSGKRKISTTRVDKGKESTPIWVPGEFCRAGVKVFYEGFVTDNDRAIIDISDDKGTDRISVYKGSRFLDDKCSVEELVINGDNETGKVAIKCVGGEKIELRLGGRLNLSDRLYLNEEYDSSKENLIVYYDIDKKSKSELIINKELVKFNNKDVGIVRVGRISITKEAIDKIVKDGQLENKIKELLYSLEGAKIEKNVIILEKKEGDKKEAEKDNDFNEAIKSLERVADEYPQERKKDNVIEERWGEKALKKAIELAERSGKEETKVRLMNKFIEIYPDGRDTEFYRQEINRVGAIDSSNAVSAVKIDNRFRNVRLVHLEKKSKESNARFSVSNNIDNVEVKEGGSSGELSKGEGYVSSITLDKIIDEENVNVRVSCWKKNEKSEFVQENKGSLNLKREADATSICGKSFIRLESVNLKQIAKVRLVPEARGPRTETNLSVTIGIEKRAIKLSTEKTEEMIENLNKSIKKWESINEKLGKIVEGLKGACFATAGVLTVKNFFTGLSGEALARKKVMEGENGWIQRCNDMINTGEKDYKTLHECLIGERGKINADIDKVEEVLNKVDERMERIDKNNPAEGGGFLGFGSSVDRSKAAVQLCNELKSDYGSQEITDKDGEQKKINEILGNDCNEEYNTKRSFGYEELREIEFNLLLNKKEGVSDKTREKAGGLLKSSAQRILDDRGRYQKAEEARALKSQGMPSPAYIPGKGRGALIADVVPAGNLAESLRPVNIGSTHLISVNVGNTKRSSTTDSPNTGFDADTYLIGVGKAGENYNPAEVFEKKNGQYVALEENRRAEFLDTYGIGQIAAQETVSCQNSYDNPEVKYYEREPYKGLPAIVPFDVREGWYAATRQTLPFFGGTKAFDQSGRVASFYLCNVGKNKREQFFEGGGDDICQQINLNTGQPLDVFSCLSEAEARRKVAQAVEALNDAADQYGRGSISIKGVGYPLKVGKPASAIPGAQCENFMSPEDCHILFNVCDPVVCPSSRCDFGGQFPVADVIQTGIVGSALLCLPNAREGIVVPVCLTGIHAGIEGFVSILRNHRDCLQESLKSGRMIGLCDQLYSVYLCEFFWRQIAPVAKVLLPKIIEGAYGQGTRGGGEYLSVMAAWENTKNSVDYFTQSYAVNSFKAFRARSIEEVGGDFCKAFVSAKAPTSFKTLVEPDSPPQFHAWFSTTKYSDVTVPATSQYKVFYHIFAGKDQGVYYNIYLKNPPETSYYATAALVSVASGFVGRGQYVTESKDFTAPEGYKELCVRVNDQEECGFKEVSTSFALDYLRDGYMKGELEQDKIKSEKECVSGSSIVNNPGAVGALINPNIQAGVEEAFLPRAYERGIVRICATNNPGSQTNPTRFVDVGYCDDEKLRCWLDKESVDNAISDNNKGLRNATLSEIESRQRNDLANKGIILGDDVAVAEIGAMEKEVERVKGKAGITNEEINVTINRLDSLLDKVILNHHKANILYLIGDVKASVVENKNNVKKSEEAKRQEPSVTEEEKEENSELGIKAIDIEGSRILEVDDSVPKGSLQRDKIMDIKINGFSGNISLSRLQAKKAKITITHTCNVLRYVITKDYRRLTSIVIDEEVKDNEDVNILNLDQISEIQEGKIGKYTIFASCVREGRLIGEFISRTLTIIDDTLNK